MKKTPRADQTQAIEDLRSAMRETRRAVMQAPTGFGKTVVAASICEAARNKDKHILVTVPAISLIDQTVEAFYHQGIEDIGVIQASHHLTDHSKPVQIASVQTLVSRGIEELRADVVIVDEIHRWFKLFERWFNEERWQKVPIIGMSATPWTRGLGAWFDTLVVANTIEGMISDQTLVPFRVFAASHPDLEGVRIVAGDYVQDDLADRVNKPKLIADIVDTWRQLGEDRPTVAFCVNRAHAAQVAEEFSQAGISAGYMDCETPLPERREVRRQFLRGDIRILCNVDVIGLGVDWPEVACISYCRPTRSEMRYVQNIGRGLRTADGKTDLIIIDHSDTTRRLGFVTDINYTELDDGKTKVAAKPGVELPKECPSCHYMKPPRKAECPNCGFKAEHHAKPVLVERGTLREIKPAVRKPDKVERFPNRAETYAMLLGYCQIYGKKPGMAFFKYRELYGTNLPSQWGPRTVTPIPPSEDLILWLKSQAIRWVRGKARNGNGNRYAGPVSERDQMFIDRVAAQARSQYVEGTLMTEQDMLDFSLRGRA